MPSTIGEYSKGAYLFIRHEDSDLYTTGVRLLETPGSHKAVLVEAVWTYPDIPGHTVGERIFVVLGTEVRQHLTPRELALLADRRRMLHKGLYLATDTLGA